MPESLPKCEQCGTEGAEDNEKLTQEDYENLIKAANFGAIYATTGGAIEMFLGLAAKLRRLLK